jgi:hypothetical protein
MARFERVATTCAVAFLSVMSCSAPDTGGGSSAVHRIYPHAVAPQQIQRMTGALSERIIDESSGSAPSGAHLNYYGGRVVSNVQVVQVLYGAGSYIPQITSTASPSIATFYQGVLNSPYVDWLTEYNTTGLGPPTSNQTIGHGSFSQQVMITPSAANNGATIDDTNIQAELGAQIQAGTLPAPTQDAAGNNNTYYAVFFPHGKKITMQGNASCVQFCAYHGTIANAGGKGEIYYGIHPDFQTGSGCESGCGAAPTSFGNTTQVASHELVETITDAEVGLAGSFAPPLAWYDTNYGEIGDICNDVHGTIVGSDMVTYDVQKEFSNLAQDCIVSRVVTPTFTVMPTTFEGGAAVTGTVSLGTVAPAGGTVVTLSSDVPSLVTVPASVTVAAGSTSATFPVTSMSTATETPVVLTATFPTTTLTASLTVLASPTVASLAVSPTSVVGGNASTGTVTLSGPAPAGGAAVSLSSSIPTAASVPATVTVAAGATMATFTVTTSVVTTPQVATISASYHDTTKTAMLTVTGTPQLASASVSPATVDAGSYATLTVTLTNPASTGGLVVTLMSSNTAVAPVPPSLTVAAGATSATFMSMTSQVSAPTSVTFTATDPLGTTKTATFTVAPPGNAAFDATFKVPRCTTVSSYCDTGTTLINGRANISNGAELHTPNTVAASCVDGTAGSYHSDESIDRLRISTIDGTSLAAGKMVRADATVYAFNTSDALDIFFAPDVTAPVWTLMGTVPSNVSSALTVLSVSFVMPSATQPAIRANWRYFGSAIACTTGVYDDHDDLAFAVVPPPPVNQPPSVNAGPDLTVTLPGSASLVGTVTDDGLPNPPGAVTTTWSQVSGPGTATFASPSATSTTATFSVAGSYVLRLTANDGALTASDDVSVTVNPVPNQPPVVNAGPDLAVTFPGPASLVGTVTDDGLPNPPGAVTTTWLQVSGPGTATFASPSATSTTVTFSVAGPYVLRLTANDGALSASDDVQVTVLPQNQPPVVNAGPDQIIVAGNFAILHGSVTDDGLPNPPGMLTPLWTVVSGPGPVTWQTTTSVETAAQMVVPGTYVLRLTVSDSALSGSDDVQVTVLPQNQPPVVNAGPDQAIVLGMAASLSGTVSDDGQPPPPAVFTITWSMVSGPGTVTFADANAAATTATFSAVGSYTLRLTANDSQLSSSDDVVVTVSPAPPVNQPPTVNAGPDQTITLPALANLAGTVSDDGLPSPPAMFTTTWTLVSGPGTVSFGDATAAVTTASFSVAGTYTLRLTANDSLLSSTDDVVITVNPVPDMPPVVNAGPDFVVNEGDVGNLAATVTDDGLPGIGLTLAWTVVSGPGSVVFDHPDQAQTAVHFTVTGNYVLRLTVSDGLLTSSDDVAVCYNKRPVVDAGPDQSEIVLNYPTSVALLGNFTDDFLPDPPGGLTVNWSLVSGPAPVTFDNPNQSGVLVTLPMPGVYLLRLSVSDGAATTTDDVVVTLSLPNAAPVANAGPDQSITLPATASLSGTATDDGLPNPPGALTTTWSTVSGPGTVTFADANALSTTATFTVAGTYTLRLTANDSVLTGFDDIVVTVNATPPMDLPPVANAGPDQSITLPGTASLSGTATDDGLPNPPGAVTTTWSTVSGPGTVTFASASALSTTATFTVAGVYTLRLTANDGLLTGSDDIVVTVNPAPPVNMPPVVSAGPDQSVTLNVPATLTLAGTVSDDGLPIPPGATTATWSVVSGPGSVTFDDAHKLAAAATFSAAGGYVLRLMATDGALSASDDVAVTITLPPPVNQPPTVSAGSNQTITLPAAASLSGTVTDDGLPNPPGAVTTTWSKVSGPGTVTFGNASARATTATFSTSGSYVLRLTASDGALSANASVTITVNPALQIPPAPTGLTATSGNAQVTLAWNASTGATSYAIYRGTSAGGEGATAIATATATSYVNTGLTNGTTYFYKVAAVNAAGTSGKSNEASAKPNAPLFIDCGGAASGSWIADADFTNGSTSKWTNAVNTSLLTGTLPPQTILQSGRIGNFKYTFSGLVANSSHTFTLYFVENFQTASGKRIFTVSSNGAAVPSLTNVDIFALTGARFKAIQRTFTATANSSGQIVLTFVPSKDNASVEGLVFQ